MHRVWRLFFLVIFFLLTLLLPFQGCLAAEAKDYYFPELKADLYIQKDGSFIVSQFLTFEFQGQFSWASLWIPLRARKNSSLEVKVQDFRVRDERGLDLPLEAKVEAGKFQARWSFSARNERRTFNISYRIVNGILNYPDVSELYWQIIGSEVDRPTARAEVTVHLPEPC